MGQVSTMPGAGMKEVTSVGESVGVGKRNSVPAVKVRVWSSRQRQAREQTQACTCVKIIKRPWTVVVGIQTTIVVDLLDDVVERPRNVVNLLASS